MRRTIIGRVPAAAAAYHGLHRHRDSYGVRSVAYSGCALAGAVCPVRSRRRVIHQVSNLLVYWPIVCLQYNKHWLACTTISKWFTIEHYFGYTVVSGLPALWLVICLHIAQQFTFILLAYRQSSALCAVLAIDLHTAQHFAHTLSWVSACTVVGHFTVAHSQQFLVWLPVECLRSDYVVVSKLLV